MWTCPLPLSSFLMSTVESRPQPNHDASDEPRSTAAARWSALLFIPILLPASPYPSIPCPAPGEGTPPPSSPQGESRSTIGSKQESNRRFRASVRAKASPQGMAGGRPVAHLYQVDDRGDARGPAR